MLLPLLRLWASRIPRRSPQREHSLHMARISLRSLLHNLLDLNLRHTHPLPTSPPTPRQEVRISSLPISNRCHRFLDRTPLQHLHHRLAIRHRHPPSRLPCNDRPPASCVFLPILPGIPFDRHHLLLFQILQRHRNPRRRGIKERRQVHQRAYCLGQRHNSSKSDRRCRLHQLLEPRRLSRVC